MKIKSADDDDDTPLPPPPSVFEPVTPPPLPLPPQCEEEEHQPPRVHRPKPVDPRIHRHQMATQQHKDEKKKRTTNTKHAPAATAAANPDNTTFSSYIIEHVVRKMSRSDWMEFIATYSYGKPIIKDLQRFLTGRYCNEEHTGKQKHYGHLRNISMYLACYGPYEVDMSAKQYHLREDGEIPSSSSRRTPKTCYLWEFGGGSFPVFISDEEYDNYYFTPQKGAVEDYTEPSG